MSQSIIDTNVIQKSFDEGFGWGINLVVSTVVNVVKNFLFSNWRYILLFFAVLGAGMILQILMLREGRHNKLPAWFNSLVGSVFYFIFLVLIKQLPRCLTGLDSIPTI